MKTIISITIVLILSAAAAGLYGFAKSGAISQPAVVINDFESCVQAGNLVMESYPRQCRSADGNTYVEEIEQPIFDSPIVGEGCAIGGCSSQICGEEGEIEDIVTTCEYRESYACYRSATCERQKSGKCGWTESDSLTQCLMQSENSDFTDEPTNIEVQ